MKRLDVLLLSAIGISLGISFGVFFSAYAFDGMVMICLLGIAFGFSFFGRPFFVSFIVLLISLLLGLFFGNREFQYWERLDEPKETIRGISVVTSGSREKAFFHESEIRMEDCEGDFCPKEKILLRKSESNERMIGDRLVFVCDLKKPEEYIEIAGREVAYRMMLATRGIGYLCERPISTESLSPDEDWYLRLMRALFSVKERFIIGLERSLPSSEAALSLGMLIGFDDGFSNVEKDIFIRSGVTHVTAVSGYNITLVGGLLFFLAIVFGWYRREASLFAIIGIVFYVMLVGAPASAVRAGIMGALLLSTLSIGRPGSAFRIWIIALTCMLIWNPLLIRYDIGFELSYLATLALLLYASVRDRLWMPRNIVARFFYELLLLSLFVEWLVVPVILLQFGTFSVVSIIANVFLVPLVPIIMFFAFLSGLVGVVIPGGIFFLAWPNFFFAHLFLVGAEFFSGLPMSFLSNLTISPWWVALWYMVTGYLFLIFSNSGETPVNTGVSPLFEKKVRYNK
ncbi:MAG: competence protein ComEC [Patescibacteria group bacterium]|nr:competence protein ComEC [Patescibacteria group bacterium]